jgi:glycosyltransferase involved in cell wall biosynthesis
MRSAIRVLLKHPEKRRNIEAQARRAAEQKFDWNAIAREQRRLYDQLAGVARGAQYAVR